MKNDDSREQVTTPIKMHKAKDRELCVRATNNNNLESCSKEIWKIGKQ